MDPLNLVSLNGADAAGALVRKAILDEGNGGLHEDEIQFLTGLSVGEVEGALVRLAGRVAEVEPGVWMVVV